MTRCIVSMQSFGERIRSRRLELKITQEKLAEAVSVDPSYIRHLEHGRRFGSIDFIVKLAKALKLRPGELVDLYADVENTREGEEALLPPAARTMPNEYQGRIRLYVKDMIRLYDLEYTRNIDSSGNQIPSGVILERSLYETGVEMAGERKPNQPEPEVKNGTNGNHVPLNIIETGIDE
jgi:transcriptional regulator with XRE-family HTH domain